MLRNPKPTPQCERWFKGWKKTKEHAFESAQLCVTPQYMDREEFVYDVLIRSEPCGFFVENLREKLERDNRTWPRVRQKVGKEKEKYVIGGVLVPVYFAETRIVRSATPHTYVDAYSFGERLLPVGYHHISEKRAATYLRTVEQTLQSDQLIYEGLLAEGVLGKGLVIRDWFLKLLCFACRANVTPNEFEEQILLLNKSEIENSWRYVSPATIEEIYDLGRSIVAGR